MLNTNARGGSTVNTISVISFFREEWKDVAGWAIVRSATG